LRIDIASPQLKITGDIDLTIGYSMEMVYNNYVEAEIPIITTYMSSSSYTFDFEVSFFSIDIDINDFPEDFWNTTSSGDTLGKAIALINGIFTFMGLVGTGASVCGYALKLYGPISFSASIALFLPILFAAVSLSVELEPTYKSEAYLGAGIGCLITGIVILSVNKFLKNKDLAKRMKRTFFGVKTTLKALDLYMESFEVESPLFALLDNLTGEDQAILYQSTILNILIGTLGVLGGAIGIKSDPDQTRRKIAAYTLGILAIGIGLQLILTATNLNEE